MPIRLRNINLFVRDVAAGVRFYAEGLGMTHDIERSHPPGFALLRSGDVQLTLQSAATPGAVLGSAGSVELGFEVDDLDVVRDRLAALGGQVAAPQTMGWGSGFDAVDPDGFRLTVFRSREG